MGHRVRGSDNNSSTSRRADVTCLAARREVNPSKILQSPRTTAKTSVVDTDHVYDGHRDSASERDNIFHHHHHNFDNHTKPTNDCQRPTWKKGRSKVTPSIHWGAGHLPRPKKLRWQQLTDGAGKDRGEGHDRRAAQCGN